MSDTDGAFAQWLSQARIAARRLTAEQRGLLQYAFAFRERCGDDYYSSRLLSHFLLHCDSGLKVAQIARLVGISRPTASHQQGISSREAIQAAHHRLAGRPHGKLLPRYAGPIAEFILTHGDATRYDVLGADYAGEHVQTLRRQFFNRPGQLYETPEALIVYLDPFAGQEALAPVIDRLNAKQHRLPWLDNRRLVMSLTPTGPVRAGP